MEFVTLGGRGVITQWVAKEIEMEAENEFHAILRQLQNTPRDLWVRPDYDAFDPEIGEIRFKAASVQHRVFGLFLIESRQYVMLVGSQKKGRIYNPKDAIETARKRRKLVLADRSCIHEYKGHQF
jgi:hypothetical protein